MPRADAMQVNAVRLLERLDALAQIGRIDGGGVCRLAFTEEDKAGRDFVERLMRDLGLQVYIDAVGNIFGIRAGVTEGPVVFAGSHIDTVATGGRYDGSLGVLAALEAIETFNDAGLTTEKPVGVVSFVNEEGVRFMPDMMGSLYQRGALSREDVRSTRGIDGTTIGENLNRLDYAGADDLRALDIAHFIELHIEQGPWLETEGLSIGVVERVQGIAWYEITFRGMANHAGATPMHMRQDAGYAAGALAHQVRTLADRMGGDQRATVGSIRLSPNLINVIAETAIVTVDLRNPEADRLAQAEDALLELVAQLAQRERLEVHTRKLAGVAPEVFDADCVAQIEKSAAELGYTYRRMISGAAHDAQILAAKYPAAMIFVPSRSGISHNVAEFTEPAHIEAGANVLLHTILALAG